MLSAQKHESFVSCSETLFKALFLLLNTMASCPDCKKGSILPGEPTGRMVNGAYFAAGPSENDSRAIILLTDIFGLALVNSKLLADHFSKCLSADVWIPDMFDGEPSILES